MHGMSNSLTYTSWRSMKQRVLNPKHTAYERYQRLGVGIDPSWMIFESFLADMGERPIGTSLERKDNRKGYNKANCYWATPKEQANNRCNNHLLTVGSVTRTLVQWAEHSGINPITLHSRLRRGWEPEKAILLIDGR